MTTWLYDFRTAGQWRFLNVTKQAFSSVRQARVEKHSATVHVSSQTLIVVLPIRSGKADASSLVFGKIRSLRLDSTDSSCTEDSLS